MLTQLKKYVTNLGANLLSFSIATFESTKSLAYGPNIKNVIRPLIAISFEDVLPAIMVYALNNHIQNRISEYQDSSDDSDVFNMTLMASAATTNILVSGFIIHKIIRGGIRTVALREAIPLILNDRPPEDIPPLQFDIRTIKFNAKRIQRVFYTLPDIMVNNFINLYLPEHYIIQILGDLWIGSEIVNIALDERTLNRLNNLKINSLPFLVGSVYLLVSSLKNSLLQDLHNPYLDAWIDNGIFVLLLMVVANLKLQNTPLKSELYSPNLPSIIDILPIKILAHRVYKSIKDMPTEKSRILKRLFQNSLSFLIQTGMAPEMFRSPKKFFDDNVISSLLMSLPESSKAYLIEKYSKRQIRSLLTHLLLGFSTLSPSSLDLFLLFRLATKINKAERRADSIYSFFHVDRGVRALENKIHSQPRRLERDNNFPGEDVFEVGLREYQN
ncbi:hypothetical protein [Legionella sp. W05-934-2]|uniref:hypothetical protein n=1 Tax=Legionella sp. W05-934-2 TaxID=1198649 RepID=UPI0034633DB1